LRLTVFSLLAGFAIFAGTACGGSGSSSDDEDIFIPQPLSGSITFDPAITAEIITGTGLTATYTGHESVTFQWYKDGSPIFGANDSNFMPDSEGEYTVTVSVWGHIPKTSDPITVTGLPVPVVTFDKNNTDEGSTEAYPHYKAAEGSAGTVGALPATEPTRPGHTFTGWNTAANGGGAAFTAETVVTASMAVYAQWMAHAHTVTFNNNGGTGVSPATITVTFPVITVSALPAQPTRIGYTFAGWGTSASGGTAFTTETEITAGITVYAQWDGIPYSVAYTGNGHTGGSTAGSSHIYGASANLSANGFTRIGHTFAGWAATAAGNVVHTDAQPVMNLRDTPGTVTLFARWIPITYTVTYSGNGHTGGSMAASVHTYSVSANLAANGFTRTGWTFTGWNTQANGTGTPYAAGAPVVNLRDTPGNFTLFAQWSWGVTSHLPGASLTMGWIPAGSFTMGSPTTEAGRNTDELQHSVTLTRGFYMGIYPVTQEQYLAVMAWNANRVNAAPSSFSDNTAPGEVQSRRPVETVSWYEAILFCNRLSIFEGRTPVYSIGGSTNPANWGAVPTANNATWNAVTVNWNANGYRLPTEAEREYACRAGTTTAWYTGNTANAALDAAAWHLGNSGGRTRQVGLKTPNAWGLYDMHGNVHEWVWDWYSNTTYTATRVDPAGPATGTNRVMRGGSVGGGPSRSAARWGCNPSEREPNNYLGFRVVRSQ
jgi:uncharacterized repeat protein (TIGR02543 family)